MYGIEDDNAWNYLEAKRQSISIKQSEKLHELQVEYKLGKLEGMVRRFV